MRQLRSRFVASIAIAALAGIAPALQAQPVSFFANLTTDQEPPGTLTGLTNPTRLPFGTATFQLNAARDQLSFTATINGIDFTGSQTPGTNDNLTAAHIHAPAPPGAAAGVRWGFFGAPFNDVINPTTPNCVAFALGVGGTCSGIWDAAEGNGTTLTAQLDNLLGNLAYINFHTVQNPSGEIRGQIINTVPEPASVLLMGAGLLGVGGVAWRRRKGGSAA
jgi:hypothetical protein